jgi:hypothetical protein
MRLGGVLLCVVSLSACATITRGTRQNYVIETDPAGAQITLSTGQTCVSPCHLRLKRKHDFTVTATLDGYQQATAEVVSRMRAGGGTALAGNLIAGGIIGGVLDVSNGSLNDLRPNPLQITMVPIGATAAAPPAEAAPPADAAPPAEPAPADPTPPSGSPQGE